MPDFDHRSDELELLDDPSVPADLLSRNLDELDRINRRLGGHRVTLRGLAAIVPPGTKHLHVADLGCGGGDTLRAVADWGRRRGISLRLTGVDLNPDVVDYARRHCADYPEITVVRADYRDFLGQHPDVDVLHTALFCHHLPDDAVVELLGWMHRAARVGFVINDLHRHPLAYHSIRLLTRALGGSPLVRNDAPLSVLRAFRADEWHRLLRRAGVPTYRLR
ncbi:MAG: methyltransferase domain-containing protein, partial [Catalinimonas sp.]